MNYALQVAWGTAGTVLALHAVAGITFFESSAPGNTVIVNERGQPRE